MSYGRRKVVAMHAWQRIRVLRARPPARVTGEQVGVFVAALEQSEQLMRAAQDVGPAARPLPLFYALSQAGRAIAAGRLQGAWRLAAHGLRIPPQDEITDEAQGLLRRSLEPQAESKKAPARRRRSSFAGVAEAVGSEPLTGSVEFGAVWAAIPDLTEPTPQMPGLDPAWRRPLVVYDEHWDTKLAMRIQMRRFTPQGILVAGLPQDADAQTLTEELQHYPTAAGARVRVLSHTGQEVVRKWSPTGELCPTFLWTDPDHQPHLDGIAPPYRRSENRLILPRLVNRDYLTPLMLWWALLFGLSSVARYDPELWVAALDVNNSEQAVPIEAALDIALEALPELILDALAE
jgi:hypothetical protein